MSVSDSKKNQSKIEFIDISKELLICILHCVKKFPKSVTYYLSQDLVKFARDSYTNVVRGDHIYPNTQYKLDSKLRYINDAYDNLIALSSLVSVMFDIYENCLTEYEWNNLRMLINKEKILLSDVLNNIKPVS